jgi:serine/threonine protein kinase
MVVGAHPAVGDVVANRYHIDRLVGVGGTGSVFEARDNATGQRVALKILHPVLQRHPVIPRRFLREATAARALMTPHAVKVEATGNLDDGIPYIVMEYLDGEDLSNYVSRRGGRLAPDQALYIVDQIAAAIHEAHARGILHRDLKPENIFVIPTPQGEVVKVVDFGISKIFTEEGVKLTQTGVTVGTPQYMPVEQLRGTKGLDGRVDVYALGVILYELLAGVRPYDGFTYEEVILKVATTTAPPVATYCTALPPGLGEVVDKAIARDRDLRFLSMADLRLALAPYWDGRCPVCAPQAAGRAGAGQHLAPQPQGAMPQHIGPAQPNLASSGAWSPQVTTPPSQAGSPMAPPAQVRERGPSVWTLAAVMVAAAIAAIVVVAVGVGVWLYMSP